MTADRNLTPADAAVAVRSFPRRFRGVLARSDDADERFDPDEIARRPGPDGLAAVDHLADATAELSRLAQTLETRTDQPGGQADAGAPIDALLDRLDVASAQAAAQIDSVPTDDWGHGLLASTQDVVGSVADHLRGAQRAVDAAG